MRVPEALVPLALRATRANRAFTSPDVARERIAERSLRPQSFHPPRRLTRPVTITAARHGGWPLYTVAPKGRAPRGAVVYTHGGAWVNEIVLPHWRLVEQIAAESGAAVLVPIYPLVPFGTAQEVVGTVADIARQAADRFGIVRLAGDSAGGQIALSTALELRDRHGLRVSRTVLIAPALDLSWSNPQIPQVQPDDPWLAVPGGRVFSEHWRGALPVSDQRVSPLAADLAGLGPLSVYVGTRDILSPDVRLLEQRARAAGVDVDLHVGAGLVHVYPLLPTRAGRLAREQIVADLTDRTDRGDRG